MCPQFEFMWRGHCVGVERAPSVGPCAGGRRRWCLAWFRRGGAGGADQVTVSRELECDFIGKAVVPQVGAHANANTVRAAELLVAHPELAAASIHTAAILGDSARVRAYIAADPAAATSRGGPYDWDPLTHLAFSNFLTRDAQAPDGVADFVGAARALLDAGANVQTGFYDPHHGPTPTFESALYGAAGVAHHPGLTQLLLDRGADPNDDEVPYHVGESYDNRAMRVLVESGTLTADSLGTILIRTHWRARGVLPFEAAHMDWLFALVLSSPYDTTRTARPP